MFADLLAIDLDGTSLTSKKEFHPDNLPALERFHEANGTVMVCTGRSFPAAKPYSDLIRFPHFLGTNNGVVIRRQPAGERLFAWYLADDLFENIVSHLWSLEMNPMIAIEPDRWNRRLAVESGRTAEAYGGYASYDPAILVEMDDLLELRAERLGVCVFGPLDGLLEAEKSLMNILGSAVHAHVVRNLTRVGPILEVFDARATKWAAVQNVAKILGINTDRIAAIGDDINDLEMIRHAGLGAAVTDALQEVRDVADLIAPSSEDGGVAHFIEMLM